KDQGFFLLAAVFGRLDGADELQGYGDDGQGGDFQVAEVDGLAQGDEVLGRDRRGRDGPGAFRGTRWGPWGWARAAARVGGPRTPCRRPAVQPIERSPRSSAVASAAWASPVWAPRGQRGPSGTIPGSGRGPVTAPRSRSGRRNRSRNSAPPPRSHPSRPGRGR